MASHARVEDIPDDEHPAVLMVRSHELANEAEDLVKQAEAEAGRIVEQAKDAARALRAQSAALRAKANRLADGAHLAPKKKPEAMDPMLSAAGLATEAFTGRWTVEQLAKHLQIRDAKRAVKIVLALEKLELVERDGDDWRTVDPEEPRVRDALQKLGVCTVQELADELGNSVEGLGRYIERGAEVGWCHVMEDGYLMYQKPGPERVITRHPSRRPPEKDPPAGLDAPKRGEAVRVVHHGKRGGAMSNPGQRHRIKQRDARREAMEQAKAERAEEQRIKAARGGGRRRK
jgi:vacuolar-type H+-ATPase subunit H